MSAHFVGADAGGAHVGLVEHVRVVAEAEEVAGGHVFLESEEVGEFAGASGGVGPFLGCAGLGVAVVVDSGGPAGHDVESGETVRRDGRVEEVVDVVGVHQDGTAVVADYVRDAVVEPRFDDISVVHTGDRWGDEAGRRELAGVEAELLQPGLVEDDLLGGVVVGCVVEVEVSKRVGHVGESIAVRGCHEPCRQLVELSTGNGPTVLSRGLWPHVDTAADWLDPFKIRACDRRVVVDGINRDARVAGQVVANVRCVYDVTVAVVSDLNKVVGACWKAAVHTLHPGDVGRNVGWNDSVSLALRVVDACGEVHVVDLSTKVSLPCANEQSTGDPVDVCMLQVVGGGGPFCGKADEECHLLATTEVVDHRSDASGLEVARRGELSDLVGRLGVGDLGRVVVQVLG